MTLFSGIEPQTERPVDAMDLRACRVCGHAAGFHLLVPGGVLRPCRHDDRHNPVDGSCCCIDFLPMPAGAADPFADLTEPDDPPLLADDDVPSPASSASIPSAENGGDSRHLAPLVTVAFPMAVSPVAFAQLEAPARRVAEIVEALQPALAPPPVVRELEALVGEANALNVVDASSYARGCALYEQLAANEKGIEESIGPVVAFFHRPWKAMTSFRAKFANPVAAAKQRLSADCGAWRREEDRRAEADRRAMEQAIAAKERQQLEEQAAIARANHQPELAATATQMAKDVTAPALPLRSSVPPTATKSRTVWTGHVVDVEAFYRGLADGTIPRTAAPISEAWLNNQAKALKGDMQQRYPGTEAREGGGLSASGKR